MNFVIRKKSFSLSKILCWKKKTYFPSQTSQSLTYVKRVTVICCLRFLNIHTQGVSNFLLPKTLWENITFHFPKNLFTSDFSIFQWKYCKSCDILNWGKYFFAKVIIGILPILKILEHNCKISTTPIWNHLSQRTAFGSRNKHRSPHFLK